MPRKKASPPKKAGKASKSSKGGRPTAYKAEFAEQAAKLCQFGATDTDLADFFKVTDRTIYRWQIKFPAFCQALKVGKEVADDRVERSLFNRANGYTYDAVKIFMPAGASKPVHAPYREHVPPDVTACIFWLKNRRKEEWRDKQDHEHSGPAGGPVEHSFTFTLDNARAAADDSV